MSWTADTSIQYVVATEFFCMRAKRKRGHALTRETTALDDATLLR